jgi:hypothetical protein
MAGTVETTEIRHQTVQRIVFDWTSSAAGAADAETAEIYNGRVIYVAQLPGAGGDQPTDQYDVLVSDADGVDVLAGLGANLSNAAPTYKADTDGLGAVVESTLTLAVTNAGNAKSGKTIVYLR